MDKQIRKFLMVIISVLFAGFLWYTISPLFIDKVVDEKMPSSANSDLEMLENQVAATYSGSFVDGDEFHKVSGTANVISQNGKSYLRFEDFQSTNGPDLYVYLSSDKGNDDFVSLGRLKGNIGSQNYELPENIDLEKYGNVLVWCRSFSVLFGSAELEK